MCNLYSEAKGQAAIRALFRTAHDRTGNLPAFPGIFPDQMAPIVRNSADGERSAPAERLAIWIADLRRSLLVSPAFDTARGFPRAQSPG
jgi:putative SOS response-associated peptidase YedK